MLKIQDDSSSACALTRQRLLEHLIQERQLLLREAMRLVGSRDQAEDILQQAALRCLESRAVTGPVAHPRGFLRQMVRHLALDHLRREARQGLADTSPDLVESVMAGPEQICAARQTMAQLCTGLKALPERHRRVLLDHRLGEKPQVELAAREGLSPARIHAILAQSQRLLQDHLTSTAQVMTTLLSSL